MKQIKEYWWLSRSLGLSVALAGWVNSVHAEINDDKGLTLSSESVYVSNASRQGNEGESEIQSKVGGDAFYTLDEQNLSLDLSYGLYRNTFSEGSEPNVTDWTGNSELGINNNPKTIGVNLSHTVGRVLNEPDADTVYSNTQQRQVLDINPYIRTKVSSGTFVSLTGGLSKIDYDESDNNDSTRKSVALGLNRSLSKNTAYGVNAVVSEVEYEVFNDGYEKNSVFFSASTNYERVTYSGLVGVAFSSPNDPSREDSDNLIYDFSLSYSWQHSSLSAGIASQVTDTSEGSGTTFRDDEDGESTEGNLAVQDQIEMRSYYLTVQTKSLCNRCTLAATMSYNENDYFTLNEEDDENISFKIEGAYRLVKNTSLFVNGTMSEEAFVDPNAEREGSENLDIRMGIKTLYRNFNGSLFVEEEQRTQGGSDFSSTNFGFNLSYKF